MLEFANDKLHAASTWACVPESFYCAQYVEWYL